MAKQLSYGPHPAIKFDLGDTNLTLNIVISARKNSSPRVDPLSAIGPLAFAIRDEATREGMVFPRQGIAWRG